MNISLYHQQPNRHHSKKINVLTFALLCMNGLIFTGCSHQPLNAQQSTLKQQVYQSQALLFSKQNYAFSGDFQFKFERKASNQTNLIENNKQRLALLEQAFLLDPKLSLQDQQWLRESANIYQQQAIQKAQNSDYFDQAELNYLSNYTLSYSGIYDIAHGKLSITPKLGYYKQNMQMWLQVPIIIDFKQQKMYSDLSALSPFVIDPQFEGRFIAFDYGQWIEQKLKSTLNENIDKKTALMLIREFALIEVATSPEQNYQIIALKDEDKKLGATTAIRYHSDMYHTLAAIELFSYLNQSTLKKATSLITNPALLGNTTKALLQTTEQKPAESDRKQDQTITAEKATKDIMAAITAVIPDQIDDKNTTHPRTEDGLIFEQVDHQETKNTEKPNRQQTKQILALFDQYKVAPNDASTHQSNIIITVQQLQKIITQHPQEFQQLIDAKKQEDSGRLFTNDKIITDILLDSKGRMLKSQARSQLYYHDKDNNPLTINLQFTNHIQQYGRVKVDDQAFDPNKSISLKQATNNSLSKQIKGKYYPYSSKNQLQNSSQTYEDYQRKIVRDLLQKGARPLQVLQTLIYYHTIYDTTEMYDANKKRIESNKLSAIKQAAYYAALVYYAEYVQNDLSPAFALTSAERDLYLLHLNGKISLDYNLEDTYPEVFPKLIEEELTALSLQKKYQALQRQGKTDVQIFSQLYGQLLLENKSFPTETLAPRQRRLIHDIAQIAIEHLNTKQVNLTLIQQMIKKEDIVYIQEIEDVFFEPEFTLMYQLFLSQKKS